MSEIDPNAAAQGRYEGRCRGGAVLASPAQTITIVCDSCGRRVDTPRCDTDPPEAVEMRGIVCPDCDNGEFDLPAYFDRNGIEVSGDPETFKEPSGS